MLRYFLHIVTLLASLCFAEFSVPPGTRSQTADWSLNPVYRVQDTLLISWKTSIRSFNVTLMQQSITRYESVVPGPTVVQSAEVNGDSKNWTVSLYRFNKGASDVYFLDLKDLDSKKDGFASGYFNISTDTSLPASSTTLSINDPSYSTSLQSTPTTISTSTITSSSKSASITNPSASLTVTKSPASSDKSQKLGLGLGIGFGLPLLLAMGALIALGLRLRRIVVSAADAKQQQSAIGDYGFAQPSEPLAELETPVAELCSESAASELKC